MVVYLARDAETHITAPLEASCREQGVECIYVEDMAQLGKACGIKVKASAAVIIEE